MENKDESKSMAGISIDGRKITEANEYKYLGTIINKTGTQENEINNRINQTNKLFYALNNRKFLRNRNVSRETKMKIYSTVFLPTLMYGSENWTLSERQEQRVVATQMKYIRRVLGVTRMDKIPNETLRGMVNIPNILREIERRKLGWFGHLVRMEAGKPAKVIWKTKALR